MAFGYGYLLRSLKRSVKQVAWRDSVGYHVVKLDDCGHLTEYEHELDLDEIQKQASFRYN